VRPWVPSQYREGGRKGGREIGRLQLFLRQLVQMHYLLQGAKIKERNLLENYYPRMFFKKL
jgi:hypothetical protein